MPDDALTAVNDQDLQDVYAKVLLASKAEELSSMRDLSDLEARVDINARRQLRGSRLDAYILDGVLHD